MTETAINKSLPHSDLWFYKVIEIGHSELILPFFCLSSMEFSSVLLNRIQSFKGKDLDPLYSKCPLLSFKSLVCSRYEMKVCIWDMINFGPKAGDSSAIECHVIVCWYLSLEFFIHSWLYCPRAKHDANKWLSYWGAWIGHEHAKGLEGAQVGFYASVSQTQPQP